MLKRRVMSPIGIEIGSRWMHAAQLVRVGERWALHAAVCIPRVPDSTLDAEADRLAGVLERRGFVGTAAVLAAPPESLLSAVLELPPRSSRAPIEALASAEIARLHKRAPDDIEVILWEIPTANRAANGCEYMVTACAHDAADAFLDSFENAGLRVRALDIPQLALLRACAGGIRPAPAMDAVLHLGIDRCSLMIITDGVIAYQRVLEGAEGRALVEPLAQRLGMTPPAVEEMLIDRTVSSAADDRTDERREIDGELRDFTSTHVAALVDQVNTSFSYISRRYTDRDLANVLITGEFASLHLLSQRLSSLGVVARPITASDVVGLTGHASADLATDCSIVAAIGLAMHQERAAA